MKSTAQTMLVTSTVQQATVEQQPEHRSLSQTSLKIKRIRVQQVSSPASLFLPTIVQDILHLLLVSQQQLLLAEQLTRLLQQLLLLLHQVDGQQQIFLERLRVLIVLQRVHLVVRLHTGNSLLLMRHVLLPVQHHTQQEQLHLQQQTADGGFVSTHGTMLTILRIQLNLFLHSSSIV